MKVLEHSPIEPSRQGFELRFLRLLPTGLLSAAVILTSVAINTADARHSQRHRDGGRIVGGAIAGAILGGILGGNRGAGAGALIGIIGGAVRNGERRRYRNWEQRQWRGDYRPRW